MTPYAQKVALALQKPAMTSPAMGTGQMPVSTPDLIGGTTQIDASNPIIGSTAPTMAPPTGNQGAMPLTPGTLGPNGFPMGKPVNAMPIGADMRGPIGRPMASAAPELPAWRQAIQARQKAWGGSPGQTMGRPDGGVGGRGR